LYESKLPLGMTVVVAVYDRLDPGGVDLRRRDPRGLILGGARLEGADLRDADLSNSDCRFADSRGCDLRGARLDGARVDGARFTGALLNSPLGFSGAVLGELAPGAGRRGSAEFDEEGWRS
jgi:uncharacterized protein YjbI with pentapeptide repeats